MSVDGLRTESSAMSPNLIGGHSDNSVGAGVYGATIGGGGSGLEPNQVTDRYSTVSGGLRNQAGDGAGTTSNADMATVGGGYENAATGARSTVSGGDGNNASGVASTVCGGSDNDAGGDYSFAAGRHAKANHNGTFVWADSNAANFASTGTDQFQVRASGGIYVYTSSDLSTGSYIPAGSNGWTVVSDRATKENFTPVDKRAILNQLAEMPLTEYNLKSQDPSIRHLGPVAQDFALFGYGETDKGINMQDADGVALAAIQGLYEIVEEKNVQIATQQQEIAELAARLATLEELVKRADPAREAVSR
jgi:hypothetical protein